MDNKANIGSGQNLIVEKNAKGGYDVFLQTNLTEKSAYVCIASTKQLVQHGDKKVYV